MSDTESGDDDGVAAAATEAVASETREDMERRHKAEVRELDTKRRAMVKQANKNRKKVAEAEAAATQMQYELRDKHRAECDAMDELEEKGLAQAPPEGDSAEAAAAAAAAATATAAAEKAREEEERQKRKAKASRKKEKAREKELEKERQREEERAAAGPDARVVELEALNTCLRPRGLAVAPIKSDGNCLYRAVAHQLRVSGRRPTIGEADYAPMRAAAAARLRESPGEYMPFTEAEDEGSYEEYCSRVESSADWGGEVELRALAEALGVPIEVWRAGAAEPMVVGGEEGGAGDGAAPLRVSFHEHYYALGEHYNSVVPAHMVAS